MSLARFRVLLSIAVVAGILCFPAPRAGADSIAQTRALLQRLTATLAKQDALSESLAERYNAAKASMAALDAELRGLQAQAQAASQHLAVTSRALAKAAVNAYVFDVSEADFLALFHQDVTKSDARKTYERIVIGDLEHLTHQIKSQQATLRQIQQQESSKRATVAIEAAHVRSYLAQNAANEAATRATLATVTVRLRSQVIAYEIGVAQAAAARHDTAGVAAAIAAAAAIGGQRAADEVTAALQVRTGVGGSAAGSAEGLAALAAAKSVIGLPYVWGGESPVYGFDCSGLTQYAWARAGFRIPRTAATQWNGLHHIPLNQLQPGDLLFYYNLDNDHQVDHVVMYAGSGPWGTNTIIAAAHRGTTVALAPIFTYGLIGAARP